MSKAKGSKFERDICKLLSVWWTDDPNEDFVFWRSATSGGMSTMRARKGKKTQGHCGDIMAVDHVGAPLTALITIELKRGYHANTTIQDLIDRTDRHKASGIECFIDQARGAAKRAGTKYWMVIFRRDQREAIVIMPWRLANILTQEDICDPMIKLECMEYGRLGITTLNSFLEVVKPKLIRKLANAQANQA